MTRTRLSLVAAAALALAACSDAATPDDPPGATSVDDPAQDMGLVAPGAEGDYEGDPLAGADLDPTDDPL